MLELDDIQHFLLTRPRALAARYGFLSFRRPDQGRAWLSGIIDRVGTGRAAIGGPLDPRWVTVAFTWNGLRALGVDDASLATFPEEFRQGMVHRAAILGDTGANHPDRWVGGLASPDLHAIVILFARDVAERDRCVREHQQYAAQFPGVEALSTLDLEATPPLDYAHDHFGYRDRMSQPEIEGMGIEPTPGSGAPVKPGEFFLGYPDENGDTRSVAAAGDPFQERQLSRLSADGRARRRVPRFSAGQRQNARGAGADRGEADGPLAQWSPARARATTG